jgi:hypothetical protein
MPIAKCYFVHVRKEYYGFFVHADSPGKAKRRAASDLDCIYGDWVYLRATRERRLDDKPITYQNLLDAGMDMTFEGEIIQEWEFTNICNCPVCNARRVELINQLPKGEQHAQL